MHEDTATADTDLLAAIGRIVVEAAMLEYSVASLIAAAEGLQGVEREERARAVTASTGMAMRLFEKLAEGRDDLRPLCRDTKGLLQARHSLRTPSTSKTPLPRAGRLCSSFIREPARP